MSKPRYSTMQQLRNWYVVDQILFENDAKNVIKKGNDYKEYITLKASMLLNLNEFYQNIKIDSDKTKYKNSEMLHESALMYAKKSKAVAALLVNRPEWKKVLTEQTVSQFKRSNKSLPVEKISDIIIEAQFKSFAMDNAFVGIPLLENKFELIPNDFKSQIYYEAYKLQRNALIKLANKTI
jgi:hypothetical protein